MGQVPGSVVTVNITQDVKRRLCSEGSGLYVDLFSTAGSLAVFANSESLVPWKAGGPLELKLSFPTPTPIPFVQLDEVNLWFPNIVQCPTFFFRRAQRDVCGLWSENVTGFSTLPFTYTHMHMYMHAHRQDTHRHKHIHIHTQT